VANDLRLAGKTALVTGASSGLGLRFAMVLARAGARVALAARRTDRLTAAAKEIAAFGGRAIPVRLDVTDHAAIRAAVDEAETELGPIDILINNSGISAQKKIVDVTAADYDAVMNTNTKGAFFVAQEVGRRMISHGRKGRIVNIASVAGLRVIGQLSVYCMSKAAVVQMTRAMALEWLRHGINVNAICPGYIETEINRDYWATDAGRKLIGYLPRRRVGRPEHLDGLVLLLASDESEFINGAIIPADDGQMIT
jgi:NAD(P)-dependent dehydrogenase (short-subunit alcohol dehydrogenase family)